MTHLDTTQRVDLALTFLAALALALMLLYLAGAALDLEGLHGMERERAAFCADYPDAGWCAGGER